MKHYNVSVISRREGQEVSVKDHVWPACASAYLQNSRLLTWEAGEGRRVSQYSIVLTAPIPLAVDEARWADEITRLLTRRYGTGVWARVQRTATGYLIGASFFLRPPPAEREVWNTIAEGFAALWGVPRRGDTQYVLAREQASLLQLAASFLVIAAPVDMDTWAKDMESCLSGVYGFDCQVTIEEEV